MNAVMISIQPKWCELIVNGHKTIEVRKTRPKIDTPFKVYIYQTRESKKMFLDHHFNSFFAGKSHYSDMGKVIGEFMCDRIDEFEVSEAIFICDTNDIYDVIPPSFDYSKTCLTLEELYSYGNEKPIYGLHISDLKIYDKPKETSEFYKPLKYDEDGVICGTKQEISNIYEWDCYTLFKVPNNCECTLLGCPKLREFYKITRPPQNWCYVEEL